MKSSYKQLLKQTRLGIKSLVERGLLRGGRVIDVKETPDSVIVKLSYWFIKPIKKITATLPLNKI
jgi:hypothetical protein